MQAASDRSAIAYQSKGETLGENAVSDNSFLQIQVLSGRTPEGWRSQDIDGPIQPLREGENYSTENLNGGTYQLFSSNLVSALYNPQAKDGLLTPEALEGTTYLRNNATCRTEEPTSCYKPLLLPANTPLGTELMHEEATKGNNQRVSQAQTIAGTPDLAHVVLGSPLSLTAGAHEYTPFEIRLGFGNLYEWNEGRLQLVNILPSGKTDESNQAELAGEGEGGSGQAARTVSSDGRRIAWTVGFPYGSGSNLKALYVRDMVEEKTVHIGGATAFYQTMSSDGSRVFFLEHGDLYEYHVPPGTPYEAGTTTDLTASHGPGESSAGMQESVSDVSEDGSYVYFVATGVLSSGRSATGEKAASGADSLYVLHEEGGTWGAPRFIAKLSGEDEKSWGSHAGKGEPILQRVTSRVSPEGRYLAFMSTRSLTGYDNVDAKPEAKGARDEEVFLYHAPKRLAAEPGSLTCASCDPSGARPHGVLDGAGKPLFVDAPGDPAWGEGGHAHWLAGNLPGWQLNGSGDTVYQPRYLSDEGRLFFNSPIALVSHDTNGLEDVYQYEPEGTGDCVRAGGCVNLISSGQSASESAFMDADESGSDVFFLSSLRLTAADIDTGYDVWDAHACSDSSPCLTSPVSPPPCKEESCRGAASPQPELFGAPPSATFSGTGNVVPVSKPAVKPRVLTRVQKLSKSLSSCRKKYKRSMQRRAACERTAHKRYGPAVKRSHKANATKGGK
jgi:hypothetical protein